MPSIDKYCANYDKTPNNSATVGHSSAMIWNGDESNSLLCSDDNDVSGSYYAYLIPELWFLRRGALPVILRNILPQTTSMWITYLNWASTHMSSASTQFSIIFIIMHLISLFIIFMTFCASIDNTAQVCDLSSKTRRKQGENKPKIISWSMLLRARKIFWNIPKDTG